MEKTGGIFTSAGLIHDFVFIGFWTSRRIIEIKNLPGMALAGF